VSSVWLRALFLHGIKGFVTPTKSFVKIGIAKIFCYNKLFSSLNKTFGCYSKIFGCSKKKKILVVPMFVAETKPFFFCVVKNDSFGRTYPSQENFLGAHIPENERYTKQRKQSYRYKTKCHRQQEIRTLRLRYIRFH